jgi:hypothetical protein
MTRISLHPVVLLLAASSVILAQQPPADPPNRPSNSGWRPASATTATQDSQAQDQSAQNQSAPAAQQDPAPPPRDAYGQAQPSAPAPAIQPSRPAYGLPPQVTLKPGTFFTIRIGQRLSDNKNSVGDTFSGSLTQPIVVNGIIIAQRGQMVYGRVVEAAKIKGVHRLGIEVTGIGLMDGSQATLHTQLISRQTPMLPYGRHEEGAITTATADGSAPPAGATIGVLATKGHDSVIYPGTLLTFQTDNAVTIATANSTAFRYVSPDDYRNTMTTQVAQRPVYGYGAYGPAYPYGYGYPYPYYGWGYPYWGPGIGFGFGWGGYWGGGFRGGFRR